MSTNPPPILQRVSPMPERIVSVSVAREDLDRLQNVLGRFERLLSIGGFPGDEDLVWRLRKAIEHAERR
jgi:hypothetical protein